MAIASNARFVAHRLSNGLSKSNANIFNGVMVINVGVTFCLHLKINHAVPSNLIEHMV